MNQEIEIKEAADQLQEYGDEVARIRQRIKELQDSNNAVELAKQERDVAQRLLEGGDVAEIVMPPMTSTQLRRAVQVLESRLAEALDRENQARGALRSAKVRRMRDLFEQSKKKYEERVNELLTTYSETTALAQKLSSMVGGVDQLPLTWYRLTLPVANYDTSRRGYIDSGLYPLYDQIMNGPIGNKARTEIEQMLKKEGIE